MPRRNEFRAGTGSSMRTATSAQAMSRSSCCSTSAATSTTGTRPSSTRSLQSGVWSPSTTSASRRQPALRQHHRGDGARRNRLRRGARMRRVDLLGFSIGSFVAQEIALIRPDLLRHVVFASAAPQGATGMHGWAPQVIEAVGGPQTSPEGYLSVFFAPTATSSKLASRSRDASSGGGRSTVTSRRPGRPARPSTTPSAPGASRTTRCSSEWRGSSSRSSSPTATAIR
jgi:pimeloyl-ACP methyl ester carboxylesterase